ncbi:adenosylmethionine--8-amino-7-oxononanoate transaminase [Corynebacterium pseudotuberculosis]|uniref:Adenosylmethionine-8-amino-7-oxononanoate aminotransferase n=1 Tax=Corynebacterium pseudotuberculosis (strain C231) TaxID=681645 RepID=D9QA74_CORP2|nr:adenosylmethionine--8-amino-7-oxononanoate transaminase [Corynebacterium pseudotuberculosis]ADK28771.1 adenosylmethionine--8-amino-7-oxononanoate transaminase [Corynebacterium pseudotuberculosis FRC41]ADL10450.1 adenosylmethionine--8-amino-7-oxononanoate transaminase [Corynebacterium pseudotuberculosis C231]ADL20856.1 adenosylmethionine--8-amino-7-oxononanoate transaminase [Corynebacterium pseudotuberculosis 1002]ADO26245.2 adenosylmethionine--8-amino-7-oxononanoate transaminase [Corynebacte
MNPFDQQIHFDQDHIWHPYSSMPTPVTPQFVTSAEGVYLTLSDDSKLIDAMSSWWAAAFGHGHPKLKEAAHQQIETMSHVMFGGLTHSPAIELARKLISITDNGLEKVFFSDSGSVAVEVSMKMAYQYQRGIGHPERHRLLTWRGGYHGDTFATMSVCDPNGGMHSMWADRVASNDFAPAPPARGASRSDIKQYLALLEEHINSSTAGIIVEPIVQGAGGMRFHDDSLIRGIRDICDRHDLVFIADEIATGFGRTGEIFATTGAGATPDILCVGKALTGGFMSLAATITTEKIAAAINTPDGGGALMHGPTFIANPLACSVASAALELVIGGEWRRQVPNIEQRLLKGLLPLSESPVVADVRVLGAIGVVEMKEPVDMRLATEAAVAAGVWLRPFGRLVYTIPPFIVTDEQIDSICEAVAAVVSAEQRRLCV